jgi:hypothetical protein
MSVVGRNLFRIGLLFLGWAAAFTGSIYLQYLAGWLPEPGSPQLGLIRSAFLTFAFPVLFAVTLVFIFKPIRPRFDIRWTSHRTVVAAGLLFLGYAITWLSGAPAVRGLLHRQALARYENIASDSAPPRLTTPRIQTPLVVPVLPMVLLSYHEYQIAPLYGKGAWYFHFYFGRSPIQIGQLGCWVS